MQSILDSKWLIFIKVAELGSLSKAANSFNVPQSMISRHIAQLEEQCGARLFNRTGRGVVLTELGMQLLPRIQQLASEASVLADDIRTFGGEPMGEVRVGLLPFLVHQLSGALYSYIRQNHPKIELHLSEGASVQLEELISEGRTDMALILREGEVVSTEEVVIAEFGLMLVGQQHDPLVQQPTIKLKDLQDLPLIVPSRPHPLRARLENLARAYGYKFDCVIEADSNRLQHELVVAGGGYAITSGLFQSDRGSKLLQSSLIVEPELPRSIVLSHTVRRPHTRATRVVQRWLEKEAPLILKRMVDDR